MSSYLFSGYLFWRLVQDNYYVEAKISCQASSLMALQELVTCIWTVQMHAASSLLIEAGLFAAFYFLEHAYAIMFITF